MSEWGLRTRIFASDYFTFLVLAAVVVAAAGGWLVYTTHVDPGVERQEEVQGSWETTASYEHGATVVEENRVFPVGSRMENRSTYYTRLAPELDSTFAYRFDADAGELDVDVSSRLVVRSVGEDDEVLWRVTEPLDNGSATLTPGDTITVTFSVNVSELQATIDDIESDLGASPGETQVFVRTSVDASGTAAGDRAEHAATHDLAIDPGSDTYRVSADRGTEQHRQVEVVASEVEYGLLRKVLGPLLVLLGLIGLASLGVARQQRYVPVTDTERSAVALKEQRDQFDDWISRGRVPAEAKQRPTVEMDSLEDLVDVAVDTEGRVIEDVDAACYYVFTETNGYRYDPPCDLSS